MGPNSSCCSKKLWYRIYVRAPARFPSLFVASRILFSAFLYLCSCLCSPQLEVLGAERERVAQGLEAKRGEMAKRRYLKVRAA